MRHTHLLVSLLVLWLWPLQARAGGDCPLDLSKAANMDYADETAGDGQGGWSDQGAENDWRGFDFARTEYEGVKFTLLDPAKNNGRAILTFDSPYAKTNLKEVKIEPPAPQPAGHFLYLLHTSCWNQLPQGAAVGLVEARYADGSTVQREIQTGRDVSDWWTPGSGENSLCVYKKANKSSEVGVFLSKFKLGEKDQPLVSLTLRSYGKVVWIVLGATFSDREIKLEIPKLVFTANDEWKVVDTRDVQVKAGSALDLSAITAEAPAGKHGRLIVSSTGGLAFSDSPAVNRRLIGFNGLFKTMRKFAGPTPEATAERIALFAELTKRQGYDLIRPLVTELFVMEGATADAEPVAERMDIVDRLIAELKQRGVYTYLTIGAYGLGFKGGWAAMQERGGRDTMFLMYLGDETIRRNWRGMAEKMLTHVNPYTGLAWKDEPAIACVEFYNEQEIGHLSLSGLKPATRELCLEKWRTWLRAKYPDLAALAQAWGEPGLATEAGLAKLILPGYTGGTGPKAEDFGLFLRQLANEEIAWCEGIVRQLGYPGLLSQYNLSKLMLDSAIRWEGSPLVSMNTYHCHPSQFSKPGSKCKQTSSVGVAAQYWRDANSTRLADRPIFITEHNHAFWNRYQHEDGLLFAAYSALQGFSEVTVHEDSVAWEVTEPNIDFSIASSPVGRANEFLAGCLFRRGDVTPARHRVELEVPCNDRHAVCPAVNTEQSKIGLLTGFSVAFPELKPAAGVGQPAPADLKLAPDAGAVLKSTGWAANVEASKDSKFSLADFVTELKSKGLLPADNQSDPQNGIYQSETGEITLRAQENLLKVRTERSEGVSLEAGKAETVGCLSVADSSVPATVAACAVDGQPLAQSARIVFIYSTEIANSGMELSADRITMIKPGQLPVLMRCGKVQATLRLAQAKKLRGYALDLAGSRQEQLPVSVEGENLKIDLDTAALKNGPTPFFELVVE